MASMAATLVARGLGDVVEIARQRPGIGLMARAHVGQQADAGEIGAQLVMNVLGDARPLLIHRMLLAQSFQTAA